jgi:hypothetical protein
MANTNPIGNYVAPFGGSLGQRVSANSNYVGGLQRSGEPTDVKTEVDMSQVEKAAQVGASGNVAFSWVGMAILFGVLMFAGQKLGGAEGNFGSIKMSAYNVIVITLCVIVGIPLTKAFFTKFPVPGVTSVVMAV